MEPVEPIDIPDYVLPESAIAQQPVEPRDSARLLDGLDPTCPPAHRHVSDLPDLLGDGDVVVVNDSRVIPARLRLYKSTGGAAEVLLLEPDTDPWSWTALVRPGRRLPPGTRLGLAPHSEPVVEIGQRLPSAQRQVRFLTDPAAVIETVGSLALPPYITEKLADPDRYQTVYARRPGSVAAPTAGLHLTPQLIERCQAAGARVATVDLAVGLATFRPIAVPRADDHVMHHEHYHVPEETWAACQQARRVVAVGTTTVRALESAASTGNLEGSTGLYIRGDYHFAVVDVLMTNFHMPRSTLLLLLEAFCGPRWRDLYRVALGDGYRFLSFGDAMIVGKRPTAA